MHVLILSLDTSSPAGSLAILRDDLTLGVISTRAEENYSSRIFRHLEFLLSDLTLKLADFDLFAVSAGPGSFTGLRVGLTAAKGWAEVYRKPVVGVSALEAVAFQARSGPRSFSACFGRAARANLFWRLSDSSGRPHPRRRGIRRHAGRVRGEARYAGAHSRRQWRCRSRWQSARGRCWRIYHRHARCAGRRGRVALDLKIDVKFGVKFHGKFRRTRNCFQRPRAIHRTHRSLARAAWPIQRRAHSRCELRAAHRRRNALEGR